MPGRSFSSGDGYRYGFNGMERDDEVKGSGNSYDFGARIYDSRIGRWLALDPSMKKYPSLSPYNFVANNPIIYIDPDGKDYKYSTKIIRDKNGTAIKKVVNVEVIVKVINLSSEKMMDSDFSTAGYEGSKVFDYSSTSFVEGAEIQSEVNVTMSFQVVDDISQVGDGENLMIVADRVSGEESIAGRAQRDGNLSVVEAGQKSKKGWVQLLLHEVGHNLNLEDNYSDDDSGSGMMGKLNNGNPKFYSGNLNLNSTQKSKMDMQYKTGKGKVSRDIKGKVGDFVGRNSDADQNSEKID